MKLSEICLNIVDCPHSTAPDEGSGYALIRTPNIGKGRFNLEGVHRISEDAYKKRCARITPTVNDLILAREAPAGNVAIIKENMELLALGQRTVLIRPNPEKVYPDFLVYYLLAPQQQNELLGRATGATVAHVNIPIINNLPVTLPPLETQQKIAGILSAYDDLIENNRKQIKLLEEAAQKLYKEWFVKLNFPGHENVNIVDGVPEGWKKGILSEIAIDSGKTVSKQERNNFKYYLPIDCLPKKSLVYTTFNSVELAESSLASFSKGDIIFGAMRPYFHKVVIARDLGLTRNTCFVINSSTQELYAYLVMLLFSEETINYATKISVGTTMPYVRWSDFQKMPIIIPSNNTLICFSKVVIPYFDKMNALAKQVLQLQSARDKLLPKLMNGNISK